MSMGHSNRGGLAGWVLAIPLIFVAVGAAAQNVGSAEELRAALKRELAPLQSALTTQARAVAAELAREALAELASSLDVCIAAPRLAQTEDGDGGDDHT
jgi:hypothetical protein